MRQLRKAILIRDGDRDAQLDDFTVTALLGKLSGDPPLQVYINFPELATHDAAVAALELSPSGDWTTALENVALGVHSNGYLTTVDIHRPALA